MAKQRNPNGMGSFRKLKDGRVAWRQTKGGKTREISAKTLSALKAKIKRKIKLPIIKGKKYTVDEWFERFLSKVDSLKKRKTYKQYKSLYMVNVSPVIGKMIISTVEQSDIEDVIITANNKITPARFDKDGKLIKPEKKGLSTKTMKEIKNVMRLGFAEAKSNGLIDENPVLAIDFKKLIPIKQAKTRKTLTVEELSKLFKAMENSRWIWSVKFDLATALRKGELLALKWSNIDWDNNQIAIDESGTDESGDTKSANMHYVPLSQYAIECLKEQKAQLKKENNPILFNEELKKNDLIFPNINGEMLHPDSYYTLITRFAKKAGIYATPHCIRHSFVNLMKKKLSLSELQEILGHSRSTTTIDIYGKMINDDNDKKVTDIDSVFANMEVKLEEMRTEQEQTKCKVIPFRKAK